MERNENEALIHITLEDVREANRLSLNCPICAAAVERNVGNPEMRAVYCTSCETLYHRACWEQNGGDCAVLGCESKSYRRHGAVDMEPVLTIKQSDIPRVAPAPASSPNGKTRRLKANERRLQREMKRRNFWRDLWHSLLRAIKVWPSDPS